MKHVRTADGRLLNTDKRWEDLKQSQKERITVWFKEELTNYYTQHSEYPMGNRAEGIVDTVYSKIRELIYGFHTEKFLNSLIQKRWK